MVNHRTNDKGAIKMVKVKPITATPTLQGQDADRMIKDALRKPTAESQRLNDFAKRVLAKVVRV